jgi:hypothetical protein
VRRDELAEGDEEGDLEGNGAVDDGEPASRDVVSNCREGGRGRPPSQKGEARRGEETTYVQCSLRLSVKRIIKTKNVRALGIRATRMRNLASSAEDQALSR